MKYEIINPTLRNKNSHTAIPLLYKNFGPQSYKMKNRHTIIQKLLNNYSAHLRINIHDNERQTNKLYYTYCPTNILQCSSRAWGFCGITKLISGGLSPLVIKEI